MSILGIGVDMIETGRFSRERMTERFESRIFSDDEIVYCRSQALPSRHFAARFAAKEAAIKALSGGGIALTITQIVVERDDSTGAPRLRLRPGANGKGLPPIPTGLRLHVSLSHDGGHAIAMVVAELDMPAEGAD